MQLEIRNYYEVMLMEILAEEGLMDELPVDYVADLACITLNQLPVRYIHHLVDTYFYGDYQEQDRMRNEIYQALEKSRAFLKSKLPPKLETDQQALG
ncbi:late competence development ComFB family protein [Shewanella algae]|uniref:late competence development ComFB family protein n=1 Tax=Shewanella algae TaxID=38313 RepID=UPI0011875869|nr:late competence development ComFB family protein [Shewanella algae]MBO2633423.1 late competence development ComFB family protein [Shewanella algae]MBO2701230.1 late competence development ComFB family protein [Shewanella algae]QNV05967.1 competence protein ComFB [Shewanella algae]TVO99223.1 competence protein ComFB [Shewanella algae]